MRALMIVVLCCATCDAAGAKEQGVLRAGIVGCDTSHVIAFTDLINNPAASGPMANVEITVAFPGGSPDMAVSRDRLAGFVEQLRTKKVAIVDSLEQLAEQSDVVLIESVDGRPHLEQFRAVARGKPVFIDKPAAGSLADVIRIFRHAEATNTPVFTSSSLRFIDEVQSIAKDPALGKLLGCETTGPLHIEEHHPDLYFYGVHGCEALYTVMGVGCESVARTDTDSSSLVVGKWSDGRIGSFRGMKIGNSGYSVTAYGMNGIVHRNGFAGYDQAVRVMCEFLVSGKSPVSRQETIELFAFMDAADESKRQGGGPVAIADVLQKAEQEAAGK
ncbi:MAG: gfo/Idh/MocA family oxidoreductase [Planctomycetes bacterium]|nr:gfo/Idh/MocA family oxidoreductase [Planctomycetota bacterium]